MVLVGHAVFSIKPDFSAKLDLNPLGVLCPRDHAFLHARQESCDYLFGISPAGTEGEVLLRYQDGCCAMGARPQYGAHGESVALKHSGVYTFFHAPE
jgi:hypothetical protein